VEIGVEHGAPILSRGRQAGEHRGGRRVIVSGRPGRPGAATGGGETQCQ